MEMSRDRVCAFDHVWASGRGEGAGVGVQGEGVGSYLERSQSQKLSIRTGLKGSQTGGLGLNSNV